LPTGTDATTWKSFQLPAATLAKIRLLARSRTPPVSVSQWLREAVEEKVRRETRRR
jgi:hypothetical protein